MSQLKGLIKNAEDIVLSYKAMLEDAYKNKALFGDDFESYKALLRENKNYEELRLKNLVEERIFEKEGLNPPFCYHKVTYPKWQS